VKERELERDKLGTAIEQVQKSLGQHETEFLGLKEMLTQKEAEGQARMAELNVKRDLALTGRGAIVDLIPKDIVRRYDAFRIRKGSGVAEVREGICLGCRVAVRPQQHIVIQREEAIEQCAQCQRYLYLASWVADDAATLEAGEKGE
jgi:predicted  nucleic acid-binding Zn-ribbon protein